MIAIPSSRWHDDEEEKKLFLGNIKNVIHVPYFYAMQRSQWSFRYDVNICTYNSRAQVCATATTILKLLEIVFELRFAYTAVDAKHPDMMSISLFIFFYSGEN